MSTHALSIWSKRVRERAEYRCECCGAESGGTFYTRLEAHHILPKAEYPEHELEISNGMCLCHDCHQFLHMRLRNMSLEEDTESFPVSIPKDVMDWVESAAKAAGLSCSEYICKIVDQRIKEQGQG